MEEKKFTRKDIALVCLICLIIILICIIIWALSTKANDQFVAEFSFAATISSIILSILAIIMSITGESRTAVLREKIEKEADAIEKATDEMKKLLQELERKIDSVHTDTDVIRATLSQKQQNVGILQTKEKPDETSNVKIENCDQNTVGVSV